MLAMHPAQIYVVFQNIIFLENSSTLHFTISMAMQNFGNKELSNKGLQGIPLILTHLA